MMEEYGYGQDVSAFEAKTHLSELLRETEQGRSFVIRRSGKMVARLVPPLRENKHAEMDKILASFREIRRHVAGRGKPIKIKNLIEEGRRF